MTINFPGYYFCALKKVLMIALTSSAAMAWSCGAYGQQIDSPSNEITAVQGSVIAGSGTPYPCMGDVNDDGITDITDLLAIVQSWSLSGEADVAPPPDGDGIVNVDDLMLIIINWAACNPALGYTECSDMIDNDLDGMIDEDDINCRTGMDGAYNPLDNQEYSACADNEDNDQDGLVDANDPGCYSASWNQYNPQDSDESNAYMPQCADGIDNDGDGAKDYPGDVSCASLLDNNETNPKPQCQDGLDNDSDGKIDLNDSGCTNAQDRKEYHGPETTECSDGADNDDDQLVDTADTGCESAFDTDENRPMQLLANEEFGSSVLQAIVQENLDVERCILINANDMDPNARSGTIDLDLAQAFIATQVPLEYTGFVVIDAELPYLVNIELPVDDPLFIQTQSQMTNLVVMAKAFRPLAKWGYYDFPHMVYWIDNPDGPGGYSHATAPEYVIEAMIDKALLPQTLINAVDFMAPAIYDPYSDPAQSAGQLAYCRSKLVASARAAHGKPTFAVVHHRYANGQSPDSYRLIPTPEISQDQVQAALAYQADGILFWSNDLYFQWLAYLSPFEEGHPLYTLKQFLIPIFDVEIPHGYDHSYYRDEVLKSRLRFFSTEAFGIYHPYCGDGNATAPESCDDTNVLNDDGCNVLCETE